MKHVFILNSYGKRDPDKIQNEIFKYCVNQDMDYEIVKNNEKSTEELVREHAGGNNIIYAVGGDGMINKVLNEIVKTDATLSYLPYGTGNDLDKVLTNYNQGMIDINLGKINDKYFINTACFGIDADVANMDCLVHNTKVPRCLRYPISVAYLYFTYRLRKLSVDYRYKDLDLYPKFSGWHVSETNLFSTIVVCNGQYYGDGFRVGGNANIRDGLFDTYFVDKLNHIQLAATIIAMRFGKHENMSGVNKRMLNEITIKSDIPFKANIDGEPIEGNEFHVRMGNNINIYNNQDMISALAKPLELKRVLRKK